MVKFLIACVPANELFEQILICVARDLDSVRWFVDLHNWKAPLTLLPLLQIIALYQCAQNFVSFIWFCAVGSGFVAGRYFRRNIFTSGKRTQRRRFCCCVFPYYCAVEEVFRFGSRTALFHSLPALFTEVMKAASPYFSCCSNCLKVGRRWNRASTGFRLM